MPTNAACLQMIERGAAQPGFLIPESLKAKVQTEGLPLFARSSGANINGTSPTVNEANRGKTNALERAISRGGDLITITPVASPSEMLDDAVDDAGQRGDNAGRTSAAAWKAAESIAGIFGKTVIPIIAEGDFAINGVINTADRDSIFIDVRAEVPAHVVMGHELSHHIEIDAPAIYKELMDAISGMLRGHSEYRIQKGLSDTDSNSAISKEMVGDLLGDSFNNPEFWDMVGAQNPSLLRRLADTVSKWLNRLILKSVAKGYASEQWVTDAREARKILANAVAKYAAGQKSRPEPGAAEAMYRRVYSRATANNLATKVWRMLAGDEYLFQNPMPDSFDMEGAAKEIDPGMSAMADKPDLDEQKTGIAKKWYVKMPDGTHAYVMENKQGDVWLDASRLSEGASGGTKLYLLVGSYAEGNGKVFIGDPAGLSDVALIRRTENMLSLALRFGKTDFLRPHEYQMNPDAKLNTVLADVVRPLEWVEGDSANNIEELLKTSYANTLNLFPEVKDVSYNFDKQRFERDGAEFTDFDGIRRRGVGAIRQRGLAKILSTRKSGGSSGKAEDFTPIGSATLKRAAVLNTVARAARSGRGGELLAEIGRVLPGGLKGTPLEGVLYSRTGQSGNQSSWDSPDDSGFDNFIYKLQNKQIDLKRVIEQITKSVGQMSDKWNAYLQEELFHGRAAKRTEDFVDMELNPAMMYAQAAGLTLVEIDQYLWARHAKEANELIAERNPDNAELQDGGSGMDTKDAQYYLKGLSAEKRLHLEATAAKIDAIIAKTRQLYADYGLESSDVVDEWGDMFKHYVPLMREDKGGGMGIGQGYSIKGREVKHRTGSKLAVVDVVANIAMQREKVIVRGEKNRVSVALAGLAKLNPNPDFWTFDKVPTERVLNEKTGLVEDRSDPMFKQRDNVVVAKIKGKNGKVEERAIVFNEHNPRAMRMAMSLKNIDVARLEGLMGASAVVTRYFSAINTQYNPVFGVVNLTRDVQGALINLNSTPLKARKAEVLGHTFTALAGIYRDARGARQGKNHRSSYAALWEDFQKEGGQTGFRDLYSTSADRAKKIEHALDPSAWMDSKLGKVFSINGTLKVPLAFAQKKAGWVFDWLSDFNLAMENAVRLSSYKVGLEQGMSKQQAASLAKNLTVNFNRKGQAGQQAGALYAFFNASMQGTARMGETMTEMKDGDIRTLRLNSVGKAVVGGGVLLGVMQAVVLAMAGFDDDEPPEFIRERNIIIPIGDKKYITIPMPLGFHVIPNIGRILTEVAMGRGDKTKGAGARVLDLLGILTDAFNPLGGGPLDLQTFAPTAFDPFVALEGNKDWTGKPIYREDYNKMSPSPGFTRTKDTASTPAKALAEAINSVFGGTDYTPGYFSPTPDQIDYLGGQVTGGVGREAGKLEQTVSSLATGEDLPTYKIPLLGRYYGSSDGQASQGNRFYSNLKMLNKHEEEIKGRKENREPFGDYIQENPESRLVGYANKVERQVSNLRKLKRKMAENDASREAIKQIDDRITGLMTHMNERVEMVD